MLLILQKHVQRIQEKRLPHNRRAAAHKRAGIPDKHHPHNAGGLHKDILPEVREPEERVVVVADDKIDDRDVRSERAVQRVGGQNNPIHDKFDVHDSPVRIANPVVQAN